jgi:hypothetical protein
MAAATNFKRNEEKEQGKEFLRVFECDENGYGLIEEADRLNLREQITMGRNTGRRAIQAGTAGYIWNGSGKQERLNVSDLPVLLRSFVGSLEDLFEKETGVKANNVLIQLYEPMSGVGEHRDNSAHNRVGGGEWILSYNGGTQRRFNVRNDEKEKVKIIVAPGDVVMFQGGERLHEMEKPYLGTQQHLSQCKTRQPGTVVHDETGNVCRKHCCVKNYFLCERDNCAQIYHACQCPHLRINITVRHLETIERSVQSKRKREDSVKSDNKKQK